MTDLDDPVSYAIDRFGMFEHIECLGHEFLSSWKQSAAMPVPPGPFANVAIAAMGGSAAAADYFISLAGTESPVPIEAVRGYALPGFVGRASLVIALSYSGRTDEVLACFEDARRRGATLVVITHGGPLLARAEAAHASSWHIGYESHPRAALAHLAAPLFRVGQRLGLLTLCDDDVAVAANAHVQLVTNHLGRAIPEPDNAAKQLARLLLDGGPLLVIGAEHLAAPARRPKNQIAENAKLFATFEEVPETTHNAIEAIRHGGFGQPVAVAFDSPKLQPENRRRYELLSRRFEEAAGAMAGLQVRGTSRLADMLEATAWGDFLSCYLAILQGIDPTPTPELNRVREGMLGEATV